MGKSHLSGPLVIPSDASGDRWAMGQNAAGNFVIVAGTDLESNVAIQVDNTGKVTITDVEADLVVSSGLIKQENATGLIEITGDDAADEGANLRLFGASHATRADDWELRDATTAIIDYDKSATELTMNATSTLIQSGGTSRIDCDGTGIGFFAATPAAQPSAWTQTYSTGDKTIANPTAATLTDSSGGTADQTVAACSGTGDDTNVNNNFAELVDEVNKLIADNLDLRQGLTSLIDDLQTLGLAQ